VNWFSGLNAVRRQGRSSGSGPAEAVDVDSQSESPTALPDDAGNVDGIVRDDIAIVDVDSGNAASGDAPNPTVPDVDEAKPMHPVEVAGLTVAHPVKRRRLVVVASVLIIAVLGGLVGYLGYRGHQMQAAARQREVFLTVGRQAAINLTTISYTEAEADVARILDSATGTFHDDFQQKSQPFIDVVKRAQSTSQGNVTAAGLASVDGDRAQVIVAVSVKSVNAGVPEQQPRGWRMRLDVEKVGDTAKVSDVQFVP
jgi:Mce-associated membrane protein